MTKKKAILISMAFLLMFWLAALFGVFIGAAIGHLGRLAEDGCHNVRRDWQYKSGKILKAGTRHCHRGLEKIRLDGKELLEDPNDQTRS